MTAHCPKNEAGGGGREGKEMWSEAEFVFGFGIVDTAGGEGVGRVVEGLAGAGRR